MRRRDFLRALRGTPAAFLVAKHGAPGPVTTLVSGDPTVGRFYHVRFGVDQLVPVHRSGRSYDAEVWNPALYASPGVDVGPCTWVEDGA